MVKNTQYELVTLYQIKNLKTLLKIPLTEESVTSTIFTANQWKHLPFSGNKIAEEKKKCSCRRHDI